MGARWVPTSNVAPDPWSTRRRGCNEPTLEAIRALQVSRHLPSGPFELSPETTRGVLPADPASLTSDPQSLTMRPRPQIHRPIQRDHFRDHPRSPSKVIELFPPTTPSPAALFPSFRAQICSAKKGGQPCRCATSRPSRRNKQNEHPSSASRDIPQNPKSQSDLVIFTRHL